LDGGGFSVVFTKAYSPLRDRQRRRVILKIRIWYVNRQHTSQNHEPLLGSVIDTSFSPDATDDTRLVDKGSKDKTCNAALLAKNW
jgi:hypothetical protein